MFRRLLFFPLFGAVWALSDTTLSFQAPLLGLSESGISKIDSNEVESAAVAAPWRLNFSSSAPHLFASTYALLQQWGNTVFPNGHTVAAVEIPAFTLFYHGRVDGNLPPSPEWLAFDIEMAYGIMGSTPNSHMLTYQTTRRVRALYFDGESAALMGLGQLDSQMLHLFGNVSGPPPPPNGGWGLWAEYARASGLCRWLEDRRLGGKGWGFEGVVRMNAGFELIWCNFTSPSLRLLSHLNVTAPKLPRADKGKQGRDGGSSTPGSPPQQQALREARAPLQPDGQSLHGIQQPQQEEEDLERPQASYSYPPLPPLPTRTDRSSGPSNPPVPPNWRLNPEELLREPFLRSQGWGWFTSATYHYGSTRMGTGSGEGRAKVLGCGVVSWYSEALAGGGVGRWRAGWEAEALNLTEEGIWKGWRAGGQEDEEEEGDGAAKALGLQQLSRRRRFHHLEKATPEEAEVIRNASEAALRVVLNLDGNSSCSGADWGLMVSEIVQRTAGSVKALQHSLAVGFPARGEYDSSKYARYWEGAETSVPSPHSGKDAAALAGWLLDLRQQLHAFAVGLLEYPASTFPPSSASASHSTVWVVHSRLFNETYARCRYRYTRLLVDPDEDPGWGAGRMKLGRAEKDLRWAVEEVWGTVCDVLLRVYFDIEGVWAEEFAGGHEGGDIVGAGGLEEDEDEDEDGERGDILRRRLHGRSLRWADSVAELLAWLGWESEFIGCRSQCAWNERCYIPMWPLMAWRGRRIRPSPSPPPRYGGNGTSPWRPGPTASPPGGGGGGGGDGSNNGSHPQPPRWRLPPARSPFWMGDDTDLWEPKCVDMEFLMGQRPGAE